MRFAISNNVRVEAAPSVSGNCPACEGKMLARCGTRRIWHWAHKGTNHCDQWWEPETEWHRNWKAKFPESWTEVVQQAPSGERHIADVKTANGYVIEFQHSHISDAERLAREQFYEQLIWVVDGLRLKQDQNFLNAVRLGRIISGRSDRIVFNGNGFQVTKRWMLSQNLVCLDFGENDLWCVSPHRKNWQSFAAQISKTQLVDALQGGSLPPHALQLLHETQTY